MSLMNNNSLNSSQQYQLHSTPLASYQQCQYGPPGPQGQFVGYMSPPVIGNDLNSKLDMLTNKIDELSIKLNKLDIIERRLAPVETKVGSINGEMKEVKERVDEMDKGLDFINGQFETNRQELHDIKLNVKDLKVTTNILQTRNEFTRTELTRLNTNVTEMRNDQIDLQMRSMSNNLIFTGIVEMADENTESELNNFLHTIMGIEKNLVFTGIVEMADENTESELNNFLHTIMGIEKNLVFNRVHRIGKQQPNKSRPIIANFVFSKDRDLVRYEAPKTLKGKPYGVNEQFPKVINDRRKALYPHFKAAKRMNKKAVFKVDKLFIEGELFDPDSNFHDDDYRRRANHLDMEITSVKQPVLGAAVGE
ncbi:hypothetical protein SNE40_001668 [Patella caerulea]